MGDIISQSLSKLPLPVKSTIYLFIKYLCNVCDVWVTIYIYIYVTMNVIDKKLSYKINLTQLWKIYGDEDLEKYDGSFQLNQRRQALSATSVEERNSWGSLWEAIDLCSCDYSEGAYNVVSLQSSSCGCS